MKKKIVTKTDRNAAYKGTTSYLQRLGLY